MLINTLVDLPRRTFKTTLRISATSRHRAMIRVTAEVVTIDAELVAHVLASRMGVAEKASELRTCHVPIPGWCQSGERVRSEIHPTATASRTEAASRFGRCLWLRR